MNTQDSQNFGLPKLDLTTFIFSISSAAFMGLGLIANPQTGETQVELNMAKHNIDLLELIKEKTKGNLTVDEQRLLDQVLFETRIKFVEAQGKQSK